MISSTVMRREKRANRENLAWPAFIGGLTLLGLAPACLAPFWPVADGTRLLLNTSYHGLGASHLRWIFASFHPGRLYEPLSWLSYAVDHGLWASNPIGFHLQSLALHAANAVLLYLIGERLLKDRSWAAAAALLFSLHPMRVETVVWLSMRPYLLSSFFSLSSVYFYLHDAADQHRRRLWLAGSLAAFGLALAAQPFVAGLPAVLLLLDRELDRPRSEPESVWKKTAGYWLLLYLFAAISAAARDIVTDSSSAFPVLDLGAQLARAVCAPLAALARTLWPFQLSALLPLTAVSPARVLAGGFVLAGVTAAAVSGKRRGAVSVWLAFLALLLPYVLIDPDGVSRQALRFGDRWVYLPSAALALGLASVLREALGRPALSRLPGRSYAWLLMPLVLGSFTFRDALTWRAPEAVLQRNLLAEPDCHECTSALIDLSRTRGDAAAADWFSSRLRDIEIRNRILMHRGDWQALYDAGIEAVNRGAHDESMAFLRASIAAKDNANAHFELGFLYSRKGDVDQAIEQTQAAVTLAPGAADARNNLGFFLQQKKRYREAIEQYKEALKLAPANQLAQNNLATILVMSSGGDWQALLKRGNAAVGRGAPDEALVFYLASISAHANNPAAYFQAGYLYSLKGDVDHAIELTQASVALDPGTSDPHNNLGFYLLQKGRYREAVAHLEEALRLAPASQLARNNLAAARAKLDLISRSDWQTLLDLGNDSVNRGALDEGLALLQASIAAHAKNPGAYFELGYLYSLKGDFNRAIGNAQAAVRLDPNALDYRNNLGFFLRKVKRNREAAVQFQEVLKLDPANVKARVSLAGTLDALAVP